MSNITTIKFTDLEIASLLCNAWEGGSNYWINSIERYSPSLPSNQKLEGQYFPRFQLAPFHTGGFVEFTCENPMGKGFKVCRLDRQAIDKGLTLFPTVAPKHFADWIAENDDATTGDVFLQLCIFGEVIFG